MKEKFKFFINSLINIGNIDQIKEWIKHQNEVVEVSINKISFDKLKLWNFKKFSNISHNSGKFFSIQGLRVKSSIGVMNWDQPIINQPEIGYLGFIIKEFSGTYHFLTQAKIEPGNVNYVQLSPTLQATKSNYEQVHKGKKPLYLDLFKNVSKENIIVDQLQSEQGARFLKKRNRNIIIEVKQEIKLEDNFIWLTLGDLKALMREDNLVNMDTRTVLSCLNFSKLEKLHIDYYTNNKNIKLNSFFTSLITKSAINSTSNIFSFLTNLKSKHFLETEIIPLSNVKKWHIQKDKIVHDKNLFFKIIAVDVQINNREVLEWSQPMVEPSSEGICAFICKEIDGILHFIVQAKIECGNRDIFEFAPTVQALTGSYKDLNPKDIPFLERVLSASDKNIFYRAIQSEEGGRFFKEQNLNIIIFDNEINENLPENYIWMTLNQIHFFIDFNNYMNIQARSLISAITFNK